MDIGIDLGTTFSVIAVKGKPRLAPDLPSQYIEQCDTTILPSLDGTMTTPSIFWMDPADPKTTLVGYQAKTKADEGHAPIMFSKRAIGTNDPLKLNNRTFTARDVATHVLKYLKASAEAALGTQVERAVVTHPAYFSPSQIEDTRQAAIAAGFDMSLPEQMMMEPAAAALAYVHGIEKDPLRVMTYDLGGGTFDVTILERREGVIKMRAFDGDALLGGYNFDRILAEWILARVRAAGRVIPYDDSKAVDRGRRARLLGLAELIKRQLSELPGPTLYHTINAPDILVDDKGRVVPINDRINRQQYVDLIEEPIAQTIARAASALTKAGMEASELDEILLVGGSTRGPWVAEAVKKSFGRTAQLFEPDLCVGAGAAIRAAELGVGKVASAGLELRLDVPPTSVLPTVHIAGALTRTGGLPLDAAARDDLQICLATAASGTPRCGINQDGKFLFSNVRLAGDGPSRFTVTVGDRRGTTRLQQDFVITFDPADSGVVEISTVLPKPIFLQTGAGLRSIAEEGIPLPAQCEIEVTRQFSEPEVIIDVVQENVVIGNIRVSNIPADAGPGSPVVVSVEITQKNEFKGTAKVLNKKTRAVVKQDPVSFSFPPMALPPLNKLKANFEELEDKRQQALELENDGERRLDLDAIGGKKAAKLKKAFAEMAPDRQEIFIALQEFGRFITPPADEMDPPRSHFKDRIEECRSLLDGKKTDPQVAPLRTTLAKIEADGNAASQQKNQRNWTTANDNLRRLLERLRKVTDPSAGTPGPPPELPPTPLLKDSFRQDVDEARAELNAKRSEVLRHPRYASVIKSRCDDLAAAIDAMEVAIDKVPDTMEPKRALPQIQLAVRPKDQIRRKIPVVDVDV
jgi:molecular chaperone DnaK (HSP70)